MADLHTIAADLDFIELAFLNIQDVIPALVLRDERCTAQSSKKPETRCRTRAVRNGLCRVHANAADLAADFLLKCFPPLGLTMEEYRELAKKRGHALQSR
jgi:hypothetical protein